MFDWQEALREGRIFEYNGAVYSYDESRMSKNLSAYAKTTPDGRTFPVASDWNLYDKVTEIFPEQKRMFCNKKECEEMGVLIPNDCIAYACGDYQPSYEFDTPDRELMIKVREAVKYDRNGDPIKDVINIDEIAEALALLVRIVDNILEN